MLSHLPVHDQDQWLAGFVRRGKCASAQQRDAHSLEIITNRMGGGGQVHGSALGRDIPIHNEGLLAIAACSGDQVSQRYRLDTWKLTESAQEFVVEGIDGRLGGVLFLRQRIGSHCNVIGSESEIDRAHFVKAAQKQARSCEQDEGDCNFRNDER